MRESLHGHAQAIDEEVHLIRLGGKPVVLRFAQHQIQQHEFSGDERRSKVAPVAVVILLDRLEETTCVEMVDVSVTTTEDTFHSSSASRSGDWQRRHSPGAGTTRA